MSWFWRVSSFVSLVSSFSSSSSSSPSSELEEKESCWSSSPSSPPSISNPSKFNRECEDFFFSSFFCLTSKKRFFDSSFLSFWKLCSFLICLFIFWISSIFSLKLKPIFIFKSLLLTSTKQLWVFWSKEILLLINKKMNPKQNTRCWWRTGGFCWWSQESALHIWIEMFVLSKKESEWFDLNKKCSKFCSIDSVTNPSLFCIFVFPR